MRVVEPILSREKFGNVSMSGSIPPKHTDPEHLTCAYYWSELEEKKICPHGNEATGAFYNEDFIRELRETSHELLGLLPTLETAHLHTMKRVLTATIVNNRMQYDDLGWMGPFELSDLGYMRSLVDKLIELTR